MDRTNCLPYSSLQNVVMLFRRSRKCGTHPLSLPHAFTDACIRVVNTHNNGTNQCRSKANNDGEVTKGETAKKVDEGEDKSNGGDGLIVTALCRLHIGGCGGLSGNHRGGGGGLQGGRGQDGPDGKAYHIYVRILAMHSCKNPQLPIAAIAYLGT